MGLFNGLEFLSVLAVVGLIVILGARLRTSQRTAVLVLIIAVLFLMLISMGKLAMALFTVVLSLGALLVLFVIMSMRHSARE